jgi:hypothetical protein
VSPATIDCPHCANGVGYAISGDDNGARYKCFACSYGWEVPNPAAGTQPVGAKIHPHLSVADVRTLARQYGLDPDEYLTVEALSAAVEKAAKAQPLPSAPSTETEGETQPSEEVF